MAVTNKIKSQRGKNQSDKNQTCKNSEMKDLIICSPGALDIRSLGDRALITQLKELVRSERKITSQIIEFIKEVDRRKLYLEFGFTSLFSYLVQEMGYTPAAAQRRIDAARVSQDLPEIQEDLKSGALNLTQVSMLAQGIRQKKKSAPDLVLTIKDKRELLGQIKNQNLETTEVLLAQGLDLEIKQFEKKHFQRDESVRLEITLSKEEWKDLERVKELISHINPSPSLSELVTYLANEYLERKDPLRKPGKQLRSDSESSRTKKVKKANKANKTYDINRADEQRLGHLESHESQESKSASPEFTSAPEAEACQKQSKIIYEGSSPIHSRYVTAADRRQVFQRDQCCRWVDPVTKKLCGSRFQPQIDHIVPVWAGGGNKIENLQLLCSTHNRLKYERECCATRITDQQRAYEALAPACKMRPLDERLRDFT